MDFLNENCQTTINDLTTLAGGLVYIKGKLVKTNVIFNNNKILEITDQRKGNVIELKNEPIILPGLFDYHTHFFIKKTSKAVSVVSESNAAIHGGFQKIQLLPSNNNNIKSVTDFYKLNAIFSSFSLIDGEITAPLMKKNKSKSLNNIIKLRSKVHAFVQDKEIFYDSEFSALKKAMMILNDTTDYKNEIMIHLESELDYYHKLNKHNPEVDNCELELPLIQKVISLLEKYQNNHIHIINISTKLLLNEIIKAKQKGLNITCDISPINLLLNLSILVDGRQTTNFYKVNPPVRKLEDRLAMVEGLKNGSIDYIATGHSPQKWENNLLNYKKQQTGVIALDFIFALLYTEFVVQQKLPFSIIYKALCERPGVALEGKIPEIKVGAKSNLAVFDIKNYYDIKKSNLKSFGLNTPFFHRNITGWCIININNGKIYNFDHKSISE